MPTIFIFIIRRSFFGIFLYYIPDFDIRLLNVRIIDILVIQEYLLVFVLGG